MNNLSSESVSTNVACLEKYECQRLNKKIKQNSFCSQLRVYRLSLFFFLTVNKSPNCCYYGELMLHDVVEEEVNILSQLPMTRRFDFSSTRTIVSLFFYLPGSPFIYSILNPPLGHTKSLLYYIRAVLSHTDLFHWSTHLFHSVSNPPLGFITTPGVNFCPRYFSQRFYPSPTQAL